MINLFFSEMLMVALDEFLKDEATMVGGQGQEEGVGGKGRSNKLVQAVKCILGMLKKMMPIIGCVARGFGLLVSEPNTAITSFMLAKGMEACSFTVKLPG